MNDNKFPERGTPEFHIKALRKLRNWLSNAKNMNQLIEDEMAAIDWVLEQVTTEANNDA